MNLNGVSKFTEEQALEYIEKIIWPHGPVCPHCGHQGAWALHGKTTRDGLYKCESKKCRKPFTVTVGTVMESSHISIRQWVIAFHLMCSSKKGISALQLQRNLGLGCYQSAWHLAHRIRLAMDQDPLLKLLQGIVEVDETYVGGRPGKKAGMNLRISSLNPKEDVERVRFRCWPWWRETAMWFPSPLKGLMPKL